MTWQASADEDQPGAHRAWAGCPLASAAGGPPAWMRGGQGRRTDRAVPCTCRDAIQGWMRAVGVTTLVAACNPRVSILALAASPQQHPAGCD